MSRLFWGSEVAEICNHLFCSSLRILGCAVRYTDSILKDCIENSDRINLNDLIYTAAQATSVGLSDEFLDTLHQSDRSGQYVTLSYGVKAALDRNTDDFLDHIPSEYREIANEIADQIRYYLG